jgi:23S rRNA (cytidine1920-2'-O)/16S rRNA (cytidine1409-2'-O)-methyltransferase
VELSGSRAIRTSVECPDGILHQSAAMGNFMTNAPRRSEPEKQRADHALCARGLAETRAKAQDLIKRGRVHIGGRRITKPATPVLRDEVLEVDAGVDFVSRGGRKLDAALDDLGAALDGCIVVDVGASTGGFTDSALRRGARKVYAVDVGHGLLDARLVRDSRVVVRDGTNARTLTAADFPEPIDVVLVDASFISLDKLVPAFARILPNGGAVIALVKPEFEIGRAAARRTRGVVKDAKMREDAIDNARRAFVAGGFSIIKACDSRVPGKKGNVEHFVWAKKQ